MPAPFTRDKLVSSIGYRPQYYRLHNTACPYRLRQFLKRSFIDSPTSLIRVRINAIDRDFLRSCGGLGRRHGDWRIHWPAWQKRFQTASQGFALVVHFVIDHDSFTRLSSLLLGKSSV